MTRFVSMCKANSILKAVFYILWIIVIVALVVHVYVYYHNEGTRAAIDSKKELLDRETLQEIKRAMDSQQQYRALWERGLMDIKNTTDNNASRLERIEAELLFARNLLQHQEKK